MSSLVWYFLLITNLTLIRSDFFSSHHGLANLVNIQKLIFKNLDSYILKEEQTLDVLRQVRDTYYNLYHQSNEDVKAYLSNPINVFHLIKRLAVDWRDHQMQIDQMMSKNRDEFNAYFDNLTYQNMLPSYEDLEGSFEAILRIQKVYNLSASDIAKGIINYSNDNLILKSKAKMDTEECLGMAFVAQKKIDNHQANLWCKEAYQKYDKDQIITEREMNKICNDVKEVKSVAVEGNSYDEKYEALCRGEKLNNLKKEAKLKCFYKKSLDKSYLQLKRIKVEEIHPNSGVYVFHDVISDREIQELKKMSEKKFSRAEVTGEDEPVVSKARVGKVSWVSHNYNSLTERLTKRFEETSGLSAKSAEKYQISNYGLGGQFEPHNDFLSGAKHICKEGNRIATWLVYLSDVESGGHTVFPLLGIGVRPQKGSALFWYNLKKNGEGNQLTLHASCPVLLGSKWIAALWFRERGQEFSRPCGLKFSE